MFHLRIRTNLTKLRIIYLLLFFIFVDVGLLQFSLRSRNGGLLIEGLALQPDSQISQISFGLFGLPLIIDGVGFHLRVGKHQQNRVGLDIVA